MEAFASALGIAVSELLAYLGVGRSTKTAELATDNSEYRSPSTPAGQKPLEGFLAN